MKIQTKKKFLISFSCYCSFFILYFILEKCSCLRLLVCPSACLSVCLFIHLSVCLFIHLSVCLSIHLLAVFMVNNLPFRQIICLSLRLFICLSVRLSVSPFVHLSFKRLSVVPAVCLYVRPSIFCLSICLLSICLPVYLAYVCVSLQLYEPLSVFPSVASYVSQFCLYELLWSNIPQTDPWSSLETASSFLARPDFIQHVPPSKSVQAKWVQRGLEEQARPQSLASTLAASKCVTGKSQAFAQTESSAFCHWIFRSKENFWEKFYYYFGIFLILNLYFRFWSI